MKIHTLLGGLGGVVLVLGEWELRQLSGMASRLPDFDLQGKEMFLDKVRLAVQSSTFFGSGNRYTCGWVELGGGCAGQVEDVCEQLL
jgi:hypothetical protein